MSAVPTLPYDVAVLIVTGYRQVKCQCGSYYWKAPWFIPGGNYCEKCRDSVIEHFREESREIETEQENEDSE